MADTSKPRTTQPTTRRTLFRAMWLGLAAIGLAEVAWIVADFLKPRRRTGLQDTPETLVVAGPTDRFEAGSVTAFQNGRFYLVCLEDGGFLALSRECTHLGCTVPWDNNKKRFICPCHASAFDIRGEVLSPPAARPLDLMAVRIENGIVKVETSIITRRAGYETGQVVRS